MIINKYVGSNFVSACSVDVKIGFFYYTANVYRQTTVELISTQRYL